MPQFLHQSGEALGLDLVDYMLNVAGQLLAGDHVYLVEGLLRHIPHRPVDLCGGFGGGYPVAKLIEYA